MDHRNTPAFATVDEGTMERSDNSITGESPAYLGLDVGAVSLALVLIDGGGNILDTMYCLVNEDGDVPGRASGHHCIQSCAACELPCNSTFIVEKTGQFTDSGDRKFKVRVDGFIATGSQVHKGIPFPVPLDRLVPAMEFDVRRVSFHQPSEELRSLLGQLPNGLGRDQRQLSGVPRPRCRPRPLGPHLARRIDSQAG